MGRARRVCFSVDNILNISCFAYFGHKVLPCHSPLAAINARLSENPRPELDVDVLLLSEAQHLLEAFLAAEPRLLDAAEGRAQEMLADLIDPDIARLRRHRSAVRSR